MELETEALSDITLHILFITTHLRPPHHPHLPSNPHLLLFQYPLQSYPLQEHLWRDRRLPFNINSREADEEKDGTRM